MYWSGVDKWSLPYSFFLSKYEMQFPATFFCFFSLVACSFKDKEKKPRKFQFAWLVVLFKMLFLHFRYSVYSFVGISVKRPRVVESIARKIYLIIGQGAVNASTHDQPAILQNFLPCFLLALRNYIEYAIENVLHIYQKSLFHLRNLIIRQLTIYVPLALHLTICGV